MNAFRRLCCGGILWLATVGSVLAADYRTAPAYDRLRARCFTLTPAAVGLPDGDKRVLAVLMDMPADGAVATLVATADGSTSLYFSQGGGRLGVGMFESVQTEAGQLLAMSEHARRKMGPARSQSLPAAGTIQFYVVTDDVVFGAAASEAELAGGAHPLSPLFQQANRVLTAIRAVEQEHPSGQPQ